MAFRYTNTDKWSDHWFSKLRPIEKLLFNYLCDNCDIAGFIELNQKRWASDILTEIKIIEGALKGLQRGLIYSDTNDCIFIRNYLKHQKNLPLNTEKNPAHKGIIKRFELYSFKFSIQNINEFIEGASKGLSSPIGNGNGNGNGNGKENKETKAKKTFLPPTLLEVENYFEEKGFKKDVAKRAWMGYDAANWHDSKGKQVLNWKQKMIQVWFSDENKISSNAKFSNEPYISTKYLIK